MSASINSILTSLAPSLPNIERLVTGFSYIMGIAFIMYAIGDLRDLSDKNTQHSVEGGYWSPLIYLIMGTALLYLPSAISAMEATFFGSNSPLSYSGTTAAQFKQLSDNATYVVKELIKLAGLVWFIRGCTLMASSSNPGVQHGLRGFVFLIGGIFAMNFTGTFEVLKSTLQSITSTPLTLYPMSYTLEAIFS